MIPATIWWIVFVSLLASLIYSLVAAWRRRIRGEPTPLHAVGNIPISSGLALLAGSNAMGIESVAADLGSLILMLLGILLTIRARLAISRRAI